MAALEKIKRTYLGSRCSPPYPLKHQELTMTIVTWSVPAGAEGESTVNKRSFNDEDKKKRTYLGSKHQTLSQYEWEN